MTKNEFIELKNEIESILKVTDSDTFYSNMFKVSCPENPDGIFYSQDELKSYVNFLENEQKA